MKRKIRIPSRGFVLVGTQDPKLTLYWHGRDQGEPQGARLRIRLHPTGMKLELDGRLVLR